MSSLRSLFMMSHRQTMHPPLFNTEETALHNSTWRHHYGNDFFSDQIEDIVCDVSPLELPDRDGTNPIWVSVRSEGTDSLLIEPNHTSLRSENINRSQLEDVTVTSMLEYPRFSIDHATAFTGHGLLQTFEEDDITMLEPPASLFDGQSAQVAEQSHLRREKPRVHSDEEWEDQRETFERLYVLEDKPLRLVSKIMKDEFGFYATVKQYKTRISQWRLEKNIKNHEMMAIVRKQYKRKAIDNKDSTFRVRGREVEASKIDRFIKRQATNTESFSITSPAASTISAISCYTPRNTGPHSLPISPSLPQEESAESMSGILTSTLPPNEPSSKAVTPSPVESVDDLYEYFPLNLEDCMPPIDAIYRPHLVHHLPPTLRAFELIKRSPSAAFPSCNVVP